MRRARMSRTSAHALLANVLPLPDHGDRNAAVQGLDDPPFPARLRLARPRAARLDLSLKGRAGGAVSTVSDIRPSPSWRQENEDRIISEFPQENVVFSIGGARPARFGAGRCGWSADHLFIFASGRSIGATSPRHGRNPARARRPAGYGDRALMLKVIALMVMHRQRNIGASAGIPRPADALVSKEDDYAVDNSQRTLPMNIREA